MTPVVRDRVVIFGALGVMTVLILFGAVMLRRKGRHSRSHRHSRHHSREGAKSSAGQSAEGGAESGQRKRRKWRRQRREHRPLNPTLAQTGGLPPIRSSEPPQPPA
jgi:Flp pilus assembly protein TadB